MEKWCEIRQRVLRDGVSIRQIQRETGLHFETIKRVLAHSIPPQFQTPIRDKPKIGLYLERIAGIMQADRERPRKQRHTAKQISNGCARRVTYEHSMMLYLETEQTFQK